MTHRRQHQGFSVVEILLVVVVVGIIGVLGLTFARNHQTPTSPPANMNTSSPATDSSTVPNIRSTDDLDKAQAVLDQTPIDMGNDAGHLDAELTNL